MSCLWEGGVSESTLRSTRRDLLLSKTGRPLGAGSWLSCLAAPHTAQFLGLSY